MLWLTLKQLTGYLEEARVSYKDISKELLDVLEVLQPYYVVCVILDHRAEVVTWTIVSNGKFFNIHDNNTFTYLGVSFNITKKELEECLKS